MALKPSDPASAYAQITDQLMAEMDSGRLPPGTRLEPEVALAARLGVSRMTVNKAYHELASRGYVERFRSRGTFVRPRNAGDKIKGTLTFLCAAGSDTASPITMEYVHGFQTGAGEAGYATRIEFLRGDIDGWRRHVGGDGMAFLLNAMPSEPLPEGPAVFIMGWTPPPCPVDWVHTDNAAGGRLAAEHLMALGHRRLACFMDHLYHDGVLLRAESFQRAAIAAGQAFSPDAIPTREKPGTLEKLIDLLKRPDRPTGIFCTTDHAALRVVDAALELGLAVPADLSVIGFDKSFFSEIGRLSLTTIVSDRNLTGRRAAQALIERIEGRHAGPAREIVTPVTLWRGASTAPAGG